MELWSFCLKIDSPDCVLAWPRSLCPLMISQSIQRNSVLKTSATLNFALYFLHEVPVYNKLAIINIYLTYLYLAKPKSGAPHFFTHKLISMAELEPGLHWGLLYCDYSFFTVLLQSHSQSSANVHFRNIISPCGSGTTGLWAWTINKHLLHHSLIISDYISI